METQTFEQVVEKTVNWWAENSFDKLLNQNNGDDSNGGFGFMLMNMVSMNAQKTVTDEKKQMFKDRLTEILLTDENFQRRRSLHVDYHPDMELSYALDYAGIDSGCMPCKTCTWIDRETNKVTVSLGYHGEIKLNPCAHPFLYPGYYYLEGESKGQNN